MRKEKLLGLLVITALFLAGVVQAQSKTYTPPNS